MKNFRFLSGNQLKVLAAFFMLIDHVGVFLFPKISLFRIIGRLAFPIFSFMISEGTRYTKNRINYFLSVATLALICQFVWNFYDPKNEDMLILVTFSLSILIIYAMNDFKKFLIEDKHDKALSYGGLFIFILTIAFLFTKRFAVDYGFIGILTPVFASIFDFRGIEASNKIKALDNLTLRVIMMLFPLLALAVFNFKIQFYALPALLFLLLYSEKRGKTNMKYFFYIFYPVHIVILEGISLILH